ncbi:MAG: hypothetical protein ABIR80_11915, partial [Opitutaceae bacterium]
EDTVWVDDILPAGAGGGGSGGDSWNWVNTNPTAFSGGKAHQSAVAAGLHEHYFSWAGTPLTPATGDKLFVYVYLDPTNVPAQLMLSFAADNWEHRVYWGADKIGYGTNGTASRYRAGDLPAAGQWARLEVSASALGLEGASVTGMSYSAFDGRVTWDAMGKSSATVSAPTPPPAPAPAPVPPTVVETVWFDDALPGGASGQGSGGDSWNWVTSSPAPFSGSSAHRSTVAAGLHEHYLSWASESLSVAAGEKLFAYVYLDPANPPTEIMLSWFADNWEHRAYWGANQIGYGANGTASRFPVGALPAAGQWVRLEIPASAVDLEGRTITGMSFSQFGGGATWDRTGKNSPGSVIAVTTPTAPPSPTSPTTPTTPSTPTTPDSSAGGGGGATTPSTPSTPTIPIGPGAIPAENAAARLAEVGQYQLRVLTPTVLEVQRITTKEPEPARPSVWNFVDAQGNLQTPALSEFAVTANGQPIAVSSIGFRRRVSYAPMQVRDLRIDNSLYLELSSPIAEGQNVEVKNPSGSLWTGEMKFAAKADPLRYSPALHVNQEGYVPSFPK